MTLCRILSVPNFQYLFSRLLQGDRPYWHIPELHRSLGAPPLGGYGDPAVNQKAGYMPRLDLLHPSLFKQNSLTCETGPGNPSGHVMLNLVLWYAVTDVVTEKLVNRYLGGGNGGESSVPPFLRKLCWNFFAVMIVCVSASRVYNLNHFPHQCALAVLCGAAVCRFVYKREDLFTAIFPLRFAVGGAALFLVVFTSLIYLSLGRIGLDPDWTLEKSSRWCQNRAWLRAETLPWFAMSRFAGAGLALAATAASNEALPSGGAAARERSADAGSGAVPGSGDGKGLPGSQQALRALFGVLVGAAGAEAQRSVYPVFT